MGAPHWRPEEDDVLRAMIAERRPADEIAAALGRARKSVEHRTAKLFPGGTGRKGGMPEPPIELRLQRLVEMPNGCHEWPGKRNQHGYGRIRIDGSDHYVHRVVWTRSNGQIPDGMMVRHTCDNPPCSNIAHLVLGTKAENSTDMVVRGRSVRGERAHRARLTSDQVREIRSRRDKGELLRVLAAEFGVSLTNIIHVAKRDTWRHVP